MPYVANITVILLFTIPSIYFFFLTVALLGTVFGALESKFPKLNLKKYLPRIPRIPGLDYALPLILIALPIVIASAIAIKGFTTFQFNKPSPIASSTPVPQVVMVASAGPADGAAVYTTHCAVCHQAEGTGVTGIYPPLDGSEWVLGNPENIINIVTHGLKGEIVVKGNTYNSIMTPFGAILSPEEVLAVVNHIRTSWSNQAAEINLDLVNSTQAASSSTTTQLTVADLVSN